MSVPVDHRTADRRSLEVGRLVAERLDDGLLARARERVSAWQRDGGPVPGPTAEAWATVLDAGPDAVRGVLLGDDEHARDLRQNSPFAGALTPAEWRTIVRDVR